MLVLIIIVYAYGYEGGGISTEYIVLACENTEYYSKDFIEFSMVM